MRPDFLFARPSWLSGTARILDLGGVFDEYNGSANEDLADKHAMFSDWRIVGETLRDAVRSFGREQESQAPTK